MQLDKADNTKPARPRSRLFRLVWLSTGVLWVGLLSCPLPAAVHTGNSTLHGPSAMSRPREPQICFHNTHPYTHGEHRERECVCVHRKWNPPLLTPEQPPRVRHAGLSEETDMTEIQDRPGTQRRRDKLAAHISPSRHFLDTRTGKPGATIELNSARAETTT